MEGYVREGIKDQLPGLSIPKRPGMKQKDWLPYALLGPAVVLVLVIAIYPFIDAIRVSFYDMNLLRMFESKFIGIDNYANIFSDDSIFRTAIWRTFRWTAVAVLGQLAIGLPVALLLNMKFRGRGIVRMMVLVPWVVPPAVTALMWIYMFDGNFGVINEILLRLGLIESYIPFTAQKWGSFFVVVTAAIWWGFPFMAIMLLAALQGLPQDTYEAARVDGATAWQSFRYVTFPQLLPTIILVCLLRGLWFSHAVDLIYLVTDGGPGVANHTIAVYSFKLTSIHLNVGYASALAVILALVLLTFALVFSRQIEKSRGYLE
jgi:multiple sugar transport system permease protein